MNHAFYADAENKSAYRKRVWYQTYITKVLQDAKDKHVREIDVSIDLAEQLVKKLNEPVAHPVQVPPHNIVPRDDDSLMKPIEPKVLNILYGSQEKGGDVRYLKERNKKSPEDKFYFRITSNWDYGWQQKSSRQRAREVNRGRCAILRDTFYRKRNLAPDPPHYAEPAGGQFSICSEYSCNFN